MKKGQNNMRSVQSNIQSGLIALDENENWLELYDNWKREDRNQFSSLLKVTDSLNLSCAGDSFAYDTADEGHMIDLDIMRMAVFLSEHLLLLSREIFKKVKTERNRSKKLNLLEYYFGIIDGIVNSPELSGCIVTLHEAAEKQMVLQGNRQVDLYVSFYSLREMLRKETTESLYLLLTYWRITRTRENLTTLINAIIDYIQVYFRDYDNDPDMHLYYPLDNLMIAKKLPVIVHWFKLIAFHTDGIFEKYKDLKWLQPVDKMADTIISTAQISKFEMLKYKLIFVDDEDLMVNQKAICNHGYAIWIKTVDVMHIFCDVCQVLYHLPEEELRRMNTTKAAMLELYDNMTKIRNHYTGKVFFHQVYFELERQYFDSQVTDALEEDAKLFSESVDDVLKFVEAISSDDIESLLQAKVRYIARLKDFTTESQEEKLDEITYRIVDKIRDAISKKNIYNELYKSVSSEFVPYAAALMQHPQIFSSLVSAEYLYKQYVEKCEPNSRFDYSCISIMYYMSLEDFINKLVFIPYARDVLMKIDKSNAKDVTWQRNEGKKYVSDFSKFFLKKGTPKDSCEIGPLGYLFEGVEDEIFFKHYLADTFHITDFQRVVDYGTKLKDVAQRRNDAAHGGNYLTYDTVRGDRDNVYNTVVEYKGMILELMEMLFPV